MVRPLGEAAAEDVAGVLHDHKGKWVQPFYQLFDLCHLGELHYAEQKLPVLVGKGAFPFDVSDASSYNFDDGFRNFFVVVADDDDILFKVKAVGEGVGYFENNKVSGHGVQRRFQTEEKSPGAEQYDVDKEPCRPDADAVKFLDDGPDDVAAAGTAAHPVQGAQADAMEHAAGNTAQHGIVHSHQVF